MVAPIHNLNIQPIQPKDTAKTSSTNAAEFKNALTTAAANMYAYVPETLAMRKQDFRKKRLGEEKLWADKPDEEETNTVSALIKKIEDRLKKLQKITEEEDK